MFSRDLSLVLALGSLFLESVHSQIRSLEKLAFTGPLEKEEDLSAIAGFQGAFLIGSDEGTLVQVARPDQSVRGQFAIDPGLDIRMLMSKTELDIEAIARFKTSNLFYVFGSHSLKRQLLEPDASAADNRRSLEDVIFEPSRFNIYRLRLDPTTFRPVRSPEGISLYRILASDPILGRFTRVPSKENGVDIEGGAVKGDSGNKLLLGFRSPVLRENLVPVMELNFGDPFDYKLLFLDLQGYGIRELVTVDKGFLLIAGPSGDAVGPFYIYFWDGDDGLPDKGKSKAKLKVLGELPTPSGAKAEGMYVVEESDDGYEVVVVYDGVKGGIPERFWIPK